MGYFVGRQRGRFSACVKPYKKEKLSPLSVKGLARVLRASQIGLGRGSVLGEKNLHNLECATKHQA